MDTDYTIDKFRSEIEEALSADGIRIELSEERTGLIINAWEIETGDKQAVFARGPIEISPEEARSLADSVREHFGRN